MVEIILNNLNYDYKDDGGNFERTILKVNSKLKKLGFKDVQLEGSSVVRSNSLFDKLTLMILPYYDDLENMERNPERASQLKFTEHLKSLKGSELGTGRYSTLRGEGFESLQKIKTTFEGKEYEVGHYIPDRNLVCLDLRFNQRKWGLGSENKYILKILEILEEVVNKYNIKERNIDELREKLTIEKYTNAITKSIRVVQNRLYSLNEKIDDYSKELLRTHRLRIEDEVLLDNYNKYKKDSKGKIGADLEDIKKLKFVKKVEINENGIEVDIGKIQLKHEKELIDLGEFKVIISFDKVNIVNSEPVKRGNDKYHSPHIANSRVCWGNKQEMVVRLLAGMEFKKLIHFIYFYLKTFNPEDTYCSIGMWKAGKKNGGVVPSNWDEGEDDYSDENDDEDDGEEYGE